MHVQHNRLESRKPHVLTGGLQGAHCIYTKKSRKIKDLCVLELQRTESTQENVA